MQKPKYIEPNYSTKNILFLLDFMEDIINIEMWI